MLPWAGTVMYSYLEKAHLKQAREQLAQEYNEAFQKGARSDHGSDCRHATLKASPRNLTLNRRINTIDFWVPPCIVWMEDNQNHTHILREPLEITHGWEQRDLAFDRIGAHTAEFVVT